MCSVALDLNLKVRCKIAKVLRSVVVTRLATVGKALRSHQMLDLFLLFSLGFLGSFGHCLGMCSPLTVAFSMSREKANWQQQWRFNLLLNLGRVLSYALVGAAIGGLGSVLIAGGQLAGIDSFLRRSLAILTGLLLIWFGLVSINPRSLPKLPLLALIQHDRLQKLMLRLANSHHWWTPASLGLAWGLIPCGFLYAAQIRAAETGNWMQGAIAMATFGLGTMPVMFGIGLSTSYLSADRRGQLFRLGGWVTLTIGVLLLFRSSDMVDYTGHAALILLMLALIARPISRIWAVLLQYRRALGVGAFVLSVAHMMHFLDHSLNWNPSAIAFLLPNQQFGMWSGIIAISLMLPAALTSFDQMMIQLGKTWRKIHLLSVPALVLAAIHTALVGSSYWGDLANGSSQTWRVVGLGVAVLGVLGVRSRPIWSLFALGKFYVLPRK
jgi:uncharacterized protein